MMADKSVAWWKEGEGEQEEQETKKAVRREPPRYVLLHSERDVYFFKEADFYENFEAVPRSFDSPTCYRPRRDALDRDRWTSFLCNHVLGHVKSWAWYGENYEFVVTGMFSMHPDDTFPRRR